MTSIRHVEHAVDLLALHRANPQRYPYLLQTVAQSDGHGAPQQHFDILFAFPGEQLRLDVIDTPSSTNPSQDFLRELDARWQSAAAAVLSESVSSKTTDAPQLPFTGGWFLYLGYELAGQIEPSLALPASTEGLPIALAVRVPAAIIVNHADQRGTLVTETGQASLLDALSEDVAQLDVRPAAPVPAVGGEVVLEEDAPERYLDGVERIKRYIVDGDVFQVNLSRAWRGQCAQPLPAADAYQHLCEQNPAPFAGLALIDDAAVISSSPERLVKVEQGRVETRPIAGTRPRGVQAAGDQALQSELLAHPKERAEHIMLIDLERNDLGRVCQPGSIEVDELMVLESYAHVHHIVSNVRGKLRDGVTPGEVIRAVFPGGTITGCPKVRCMEIIAELEGEGRGAYTGAMGYLNHNGDMDLNILIRTLVLQSGQSDEAPRQRIILRAGAGIVADSVAQKELDETRAKARGLLLAVGTLSQTD